MLSGCGSREWATAQEGHDLQDGFQSSQGEREAGSSCQTSHCLGAEPQVLAVCASAQGVGGQGRRVLSPDDDDHNDPPQQFILIGIMRAVFV